MLYYIWCIPWEKHITPGRKTMAPCPVGDLDHHLLESLKGWCHVPNRLDATSTDSGLEDIGGENDRKVKSSPVQWEKWPSRNLGLIGEMDGVGWFRMV